MSHCRPDAGGRLRDDQGDLRTGTARRLPAREARREAESRRASRPLEGETLTLTLFAVGHSSQPFERFVDALRGAGVARVADIRTVPRSRAVPWASREALEPALAAHRMDYVWLGRELGGLRRPRADSTNTAWGNASFRGYADYMETPEFERGLDALVALARERPTAMMCAEAAPRPGTC
ncbi:MAG: DUF488 domain-containing protein [Thermoplasmatota archaeon]